MKTKMTTLVIFIVCGLLASSVDAAITGWSLPKIDTLIGSATHTTVIPENTPTGETGVTITATADTPPITYALIDQPNPALFTIAADTGVISTTAALTLDYETTASYEIKVTAKEGTETDNPTATAIITLNVGDIAGPVFAQPSETVCVQQGSAAGTVITQVTATLEGSGTITYSIENNETPNDLFAIDGETGEVSVATGETLNQIQQYKLTIQATDGANADTMELILDVKGTCSSSASMLSPLNVMVLLLGLVASMK